MEETARIKALYSLGSKLPGSSLDHVTRILQVVRSHLGMDVAFVSEFLDDRRFFRLVEARGEAPIQMGPSNSLDEGYCHRVVGGGLPELISDTAAIPAAMALPVTTNVPVGAQLVPIRLQDGQVYGSFCCFSFASDGSLDQRDLNITRAFAELAAIQIEHDLETVHVHMREEKIARVKGALESNQLSIIYQPVVRLNDNRIVGLECLARFSASSSRTPDVWFSEAAEVGLGVELEMAALRKALEALPSLPSDIYLGVNISPATILSGELSTALENIPAERIVLEITEHVPVLDYADLIQALLPLRSRGLRLSVDDTGAGYASLRHILDLKPDQIKLDISLTRNIDSDPARRALALALIGFARDIGSRIVAEGVETALELSTIRLLGVEKAQGYFLGRPMALAEVAQLLARPEVA